MPVVEKIDKLYSEAFPPGPEFVRRIMAKERLSEIIDSHYMDVIALPLVATIKECYDNVITFIKWYNANFKSTTVQG